MSNYKGYTSEDNIRRKKNNIPENHYDCSSNTNTKRWTTFGSAMSDYLLKKGIKEYTSEVREWTRDEIDELNKKRSA